MLTKRPHPDFSFSNSFSKDSQTQNHLPIYLSQSFSSSTKSQDSFNETSCEDSDFTYDKIYKKIKTEGTLSNSSPNGNDYPSYLKIEAQRPLPQTQSIFSDPHLLERFQNFPNYGDCHFWEGCQMHNQHSKNKQEEKEKASFFISIQNLNENQTLKGTPLLQKQKSFDNLFSTLSAATLTFSSDKEPVKMGHVIQDTELNHDKHWISESQEEDKTTLTSPVSFYLREAGRQDGNLDHQNYEDMEIEALNSLDKKSDNFNRRASSESCSIKQKDSKILSLEQEISPLRKPASVSLQKMDSNDDDFFDGFQIKRIASKSKETKLSTSKDSDIFGSEMKIQEEPQQITINPISEATPIEIETIQEEKDQNNSSEPPTNEEIDLKESSPQSEQVIVRKRGRPRKYAPDGSLLQKEPVVKPAKPGRKTAQQQAEKEAWQKYLEEQNRPYTITLNANEDDSSDNLVLTKIGEDYQVDVSSFNPKQSRKSLKRLTPVWAPDDANQETIDIFIYNLEEIIGKKIDNFVSALKILKSFKMKIPEALDAIKASPKYYQTLLKVHHRNVKNRFNH